MCSGRGFKGRAVLAPISYIAGTEGEKSINGEGSRGQREGPLYPPDAGMGHGHDRERDGARYMTGAALGGEEEEGWRPLAEKGRQAKVEAQEGRGGQERTHDDTVRRGRGGRGLWPAVGDKQTPLKPIGLYRKQGGMPIVTRGEDRQQVSSTTSSKGDRAGLVRHVGTAPDATSVV